MAEEIQAAPAIIVMSHGPFCVGLIESAKMVYGEMTGVEALPLEEGMDPEVYERNFAELVEKYDGNVFVCCDIFGGTPFNTLLKYGRNRRLSAIAGINMPMFIELLAMREMMSGDELAEAVVQSAQQVDANICPMLERVHNM
ncbi:PTS sugar transporter subunit IIA [Enorma sp.]|uniref:PTS sugar transporter subunit IIA n=1 Tax=Enorma sp. TaxID=1920692 RepID=UPI0025BA51D5|nr:PTS sugar transporter subunit IIA [Enorma sp.]